MVFSQIIRLTFLILAYGKNVKFKLFFYILNNFFYKSSRLEAFCKKRVLKISQNSQENTCVRISFLIKLQASGKISKNTFSYRTAPVAASGVSEWSLQVY